MTERSQDLADIYSQAIDKHSDKYVRDARIASLVYYTILTGKRNDRNFDIDFVFDHIDLSLMTSKGLENLLIVKEGLSSKFKNPKSNLVEIFEKAFKILLRHDPISKKDADTKKEANDEIKRIKEYSKKEESETPRFFKGSEIVVEFAQATTLSHYKALQLTEKTKKELQKKRTDLKILAKQVIQTYQNLYASITTIKTKHKEFFEKNPHVWNEISDLEKLGVSNLNKVVSFRDIDFVMEAVQETRKENTETLS